MVTPTTGRAEPSGPTMNVPFNPDAVHVDDPLSVFPAESEIEQQKPRDHTKITSNRPAPEIVVLISVLSELRHSVKSLEGELARIEKITRETRDDARIAVAVSTTIESRIRGLEFRNITSPGRRWLHLRGEQILRWWERCVMAWRGLAAGAHTMLVSGRLRAAKIKAIATTRR